MNGCYGTPFIFLKITLLVFNNFQNHDEYVMELFNELLLRKNKIFFSFVTKRLL